MVSHEAVHGIGHRELDQESQQEITPINVDIVEPSSDPTVTQSSMRGHGSSKLLERLPPELFLSCIRGTLPPDAGYAPQLLQLANVSQGWQAFILSAPTLWSEIHVSRSAEDSLATLAIFVHQSHTTLLDLSIRGDISPEWEGIKTVLLPHTRRIHRLSFASDKNSSRATHVLDVSSVLTSLDFPPNLQELRVNGLRTDYQQLQLFRLPMNAYIVGNVWIDHESLASNADILKRLSDILIHGTLDPIHPALASLTNLSSLQLNHDVTPADVLTIHFHPGMLPRLCHVRHFGRTYSGNLERLLRLSSSQLTQLGLRIQENEIGKLVDTLSLLTCLRELNLNIETDGKDTSLNIESYSFPTRFLQVLETSCIGNGGMNSTDDGGPLLGLFSGLKSLYHGVEHARFSGLSIFTRPVCSFLEGLVTINSLSLPNIRGDLPIQRSLNLPSVSWLRLQDPIALVHLKVPSLVYLHVIKALETTELAAFMWPKLHRLIIKVTGDAELPSILGILNYPELRNATISTVSWQGPWNLLSLQQLEFIALAPASSAANRLCVALIHQPECIPSLQSLYFVDLVEWDILFLLLERRNFGLQGVKKITQVTLPYVPFVLRKPLDDLLSGTIGKLPSNLPLSREETREVVCDPSM